MASATSHEHHHNQNFPPSPPPSPPSTRRRLKKRRDSFEKLATTPIPSPPSSPTQGPVDKDQDSLLGRIILTPVLFISFILSLSFVNFRHRANRTRAHSSTSFLTYLYPSRWLDPEPYQDPDDSRWDRRGTSGHVEPNDAISPKQGGQAKGETQKRKKKRSWHLNKKIRKVAKLEVSDAFEMRGRVIVGMIAMMAFGSIVLWMGARWLFASLVASLSGSKR